MDNFQMAVEIVRRIDIELPILMNQIRISSNPIERENLREQYLYLIGILRLIQTDLNDPRMSEFYRRTNSN